MNINPGNIMTKIRRQLTLFIESNAAENIENVRRKFNKQQSDLISSHVTLCREDEIENLEAVLNNLVNLQTKSVSINLGKVIRFEEGKGVLLPSKGDNKAFQYLRKLVLQGLNDSHGKHEPHVTLMHPRNSTCTDTIFKQIAEVDFPTLLEFKKISLIEQEQGGLWKVLQEFDLEGTS